jgi:hypothetical protein
MLTNWGIEDSAPATRRAFKGAQVPSVTQIERLEMPFSWRIEDFARATPIFGANFYVENVSV